MSTSEVDINMEIPFWPFDGRAAAMIYNSGTRGAIEARMREPGSVREAIVQNVTAARRGEGPFKDMGNDWDSLLNVAEMMRGVREDYL